MYQYYTREFYFGEKIWHYDKDWKIAFFGLYIYNLFLLEHDTKIYDSSINNINVKNIKYTSKYISDSIKRLKFALKF